MLKNVTTFMKFFRHVFDLIAYRKTQCATVCLNIFGWGFQRNSLNETIFFAAMREEEYNARILPITFISISHVFVKGHAPEESHLGSWDVCVIGRQSAEVTNDFSHTSLLQHCRHETFMRRGKEIRPRITPTQTWEKFQVPHRRGRKQEIIEHFRLQR